MDSSLKIALVGNPNSGKSTLFNALTGLRQKVANFPGVTVDLHTGNFSLNDNGEKKNCTLIDLPGTYSLYPKSMDEQIPMKVLCNPHHEFHPDITIVVADASNLKRNLFLCSQIIDLKMPVVLALNMMDMAKEKGMNINTQCLREKLGIPVVELNAAKGFGLDDLKKALVSDLKISRNDFINIYAFSPLLVNNIKSIVEIKSNYNAFQIAHNLELISSLNLPEWKKEKIRKLINDIGFDNGQMQAKETLERYKTISTLLSECVSYNLNEEKKRVSYYIDNILTHRFFGYLIFIGVLFLIFQSIFAWSSYPMDLIDEAFASVSHWLQSALPVGVLSDLFINGILAGLNGIIVFVPQIALLFFFIAILEDSGYMARVSFIMDRALKKFGLNGKSIIPLISGTACAVPAIMGARTIQNKKERLLTILVTPLMSCSARLPIYTLMIALVVPNEKWMGFNLQGCVLMALYLIGFFAAISVAWILKNIIRTKERSYFVMELPVYRMPRWNTIGLLIIEKVKMFLSDAGKVIIAISIILWFLSSYGPGDSFQKVETKYTELVANKIINSEDAQLKIASEKLELSYAGRIGHMIEPAIQPLGFDWKIGIALLTSFAAREVFVGTMSTIYSVGDENSGKQTLKEKLKAETDPDTGLFRYTLATGISLMLFYAFAMQCMSTMAVVYRETKTLRWPIIQFAFMFVLAYSASFIAFRIFS